MKKYFLFFAVVVLYAQCLGQKVELGVKGGVNFAKYDRTIDDFITGLHIGLYARIKSGKFSLQPELLYSHQGTTLNSTLYATRGVPTPANWYLVNAKFDYLIFPLILKWHMTSKLNVQLGPQVGYVLSGAIQETTSYNYQTNRYNNVDFSVAGGLGLDLTQKISMDFRYIHGFTDVQSGYFYNRVFQLSIGYRIKR